MLQIRLLSEKKIREVYRQRVKADFPPKERRPLSNILFLMRKGVYQGIGLYEEEALLAYAFLARDAASGWVLMDYYAVRGDLRGRGYGGTFLRLLGERYRESAGILVEAESVRSAQTAEEQAIRKKRIRFYRNNGMHTADFYCLLFGVEYEILYLPCEGRAEAASPREGLQTIYDTIIPKILHTKNIAFTAREGER